MTPQHQTAREWAQTGIPVFPCISNSTSKLGPYKDAKRPATPNGFKDATTNLDQIDRWWSQDPEYNPAFSPASVGWTVVDLDPEAKREGLPETFEVDTPRGRHCYYDGAAPTSAGKIGLHIDTRGVGGYVLLPTSVIHDMPYTVAIDRDLAALPQWCHDKLRPQERVVAAADVALDTAENLQRAVSLLAGYVSAGHVAIEGQGGNNRTYAVAAEVMNLGVSPERAIELLEEHFNPHCAPPWSHDELVTLVDNASRYAQNEPGAWAIAPAAETFKSEALDKLLAENAQQPDKRSRFHMEDETEQEQGKEPTWLIPNLIPQAATVLMVGASGSYKSFLALDMCLGVATGTNSFGTTPKQGIAIYAAAEGRANLKKARRRAWKIARQIEGAISDYYVSPAPVIAFEGEMQEFGEQVAKVCGARKPALIVLDTLSKMMVGLNENDAGDASKLIRFCDSLVEAFECTVLVIHHMGKDESRGGRGSSAFYAGFDSVLEVKASRATKAVAVRVLKHKDAEERETPWTFEGKAIAGSLVFHPTSEADHRALTAIDDLYDRKRVGAALKALGKPVTTHVLAMQMFPADQGESAEDHQARVAKGSRVLGSLARTKLEAYATRAGSEWSWSLVPPAK